jgi:3-dehydroshikimate dehydratase
LPWRGYSGPERNVDMIKPGLVSVTFRNLSPAEVAQWAYRASLQAIEWGGDVHVPHGDTASARTARKLTTERGLVVSSYGSYYRIGESEGQGLSFDAVLDTALELETEMIRVWAGSRNSEQYSAADRAAAVDDAQRICGLAAVAGVTVSLEYHGKTLTNTIASTLQFLKEAGQPNLKTYWQPRTGTSVEQNLAELQQALPHLSNVHVFQWTPGEDAKTVRHPLADGKEEWTQYLKAATPIDEERYALLEFVKDDTPEQLFEDADTLSEMLELP